jgi:hypothetical protein
MNVSVVLLTSPSKYITSIEADDRHLKETTAALRLDSSVFLLLHVLPYMQGLVAGHSIIQQRSLRPRKQINEPITIRVFAEGAIKMFPMRFLEVTKVIFINANA